MKMRDFNFKNKGADSPDSPDSLSGLTIRWFKSPDKVTCCIY